MKFKQKIQDLLLAVIGRKMHLGILNYNFVINLDVLPEGLIIVYNEEAEFIISSQKVRKLAFK